MRDLLFLSHCVPYPPDKGEKVRAYHEITHLAKQYRIHLACFARNEAEVRAAEKLKSLCASVFVARLSTASALPKAAVRFAMGACLNTSFYSSPALRKHVAALGEQVSLQASFVYTAVMMPYAPEGIPAVLDMVDVDSEKWFQYAESRSPAFAYRMEGMRMRRLERESAARAAMTVLTTENEADVLRRLVPDARITHMENGVDGTFFDGTPRPLARENGRRFVAFVGTMDYHPNVDAACWFAEAVLPDLRRRVPGLEFWVVGRNPSRAVKRLEERAGVKVIGGVPDVRPFLANASAIVAPLRLARGIQNKVLETLAMGRPVFATEAVGRTFGVLPRGVRVCRSEREFIDQLTPVCGEAPGCDPAIRRAALDRFSWAENLESVRKWD
jgi:sugar transferase (PEP-CTERM/EpsH1 system associated)